jgi:hypothetical protein
MDDGKTCRTAYQRRNTGQYPPGNHDAGDPQRADLFQDHVARHFNAGRSERSVSTSPRRAAPSVTSKRATSTGLGGAMEVVVSIKVLPLPEKTCRRSATAFGASGTNGRPIPRLSSASSVELSARAFQSEGFCRASSATSWRRARR